MEEDGAAGAGARPGEIVVEDDEDVVEAVVAPQALVARRIREADRAVVAAVGRVVAPAEVRAERGGGEARRRPGDPVGAIVNGNEAETADGGGAVAFALGAGGAGPAEGARGAKRAGDDEAAPAVAGLLELLPRGEVPPASGQPVSPINHLPAVALRPRPVGVYI